MNFDVVIIGSGPGGYVAAIRCAQLGKKTVLIEKYNTLGGTCLNVGCIPSKAWLEASEHYYKLTHQFSEFGIKTKEASVDILKMNDSARSVVKEIINGVSYLMKKNKITVIEGYGTIKDKSTVEVKKGDQFTTIQPGKIIIATGSKPSSLPGIVIDKKRIISSTEALSLKEIPSHLMIIGGGVIVVKLGSVFARLGSKVTILEYLDSLISSMDGSLGNELFKSLGKQGIIFFCHKVTQVSPGAEKVTLNAQKISDNSKVTLGGDYCLVAIGRRPYTDNLGLEKIGVKTDAKGRIEVNENLETSVQGIYAVGDVIRGAMLAHKASDEGVFVAEIIAGQKPHINYSLIPNIVYTQPEVSSVGLTEEELTKSGRPIKTGTFPFKANARAKISRDTDGFIKVITDAQTDEILGIHMIGSRASDMIGEGTLAMEFRASAEDIARTSHRHPTFYEALKEVNLDAAEKRAIHI